MKEAFLYCKAKDFFSKIKEKRFKNNNQDIYVTNSDISESIHKTIINIEQKKIIKENLIVFSKLKEIIETGELISSETIDNKGRNEY